jgi:hypothetical protein
VADSDLLQPGDPAPAAGRYAEYDTFGAVTGFVVTVAEGARLPASPLNFTWRLTPASPTLRFRVRRKNGHSFRPSR